MKTKKQIIKEFEKFNKQWEKEGSLCMDELRDFILKALSSQRQEFKEMVEGMKITDVEKLGQFAFLHSKGYNKALKDILNKLKLKL